MRSIPVAGNLNLKEIRTGRQLRIGSADGKQTRKLLGELALSGARFLSELPRLLPGLGIAYQVD